mgnify:CR=1 FL=1
MEVDGVGRLVRGVVGVRVEVGVGRNRVKGGYGSWHGGGVDKEGGGGSME